MLTAEERERVEDEGYMDGYEDGLQAGWRLACAFHGLDSDPHLSADEIRAKGNAR